MKTLPTQFTGVRGQGPISGLPGYTFTILQREGMIALLSKSRGPNSAATYEVVTLECAPSKRFPGGNVVEAHEAMPSPEKWGSSAWSYSDLDSAKKRFNSIVDSKAEKS